MPTRNVYESSFGLRSGAGESAHLWGFWGCAVRDRGHFRPLLIAVLLMMASQFCGINAIIYYSSKIFEYAGSVKNAAFTSSV